MGNKYYKHSRISEKKFRRIVQCFASDLTAKETALKVRLTRKSVNNIFLKIRRCICKSCRSISHLQISKFQTRECNFLIATENSPHHRDFTPIVFCAIYNDMSVQTEIIYASDPGIFKKLEVAIKKTMNQEILDFGFFDAHLNEIQGLYSGILNFMSEDYRISVKRFRKFAGHRLRKLKGIKNDKLIFHLKECEWRYNKFRQNKLYDLLETPDDPILGKNMSDNFSTELYSRLLEMFRKRKI